MSNLFLQIFVVICFFGVVIVLFFEEKDYIYYTVVLIVIAGIVSTFFLPETIQGIDFYISHIDWEVIFFLISMFIIVEVMKENHVLDEIARRVVTRYKEKPRRIFYIICIISTLMASIVEDLSISMIFTPILIVATRRLKIKAAPYLLGMTICINIAATLLPFGSAQNILITNEFNLDIWWFIVHLGPYFIIALSFTLFFLDRFALRKDINFCKENVCIEDDDKSYESLEVPIINKKDLLKNLASLGIFIVLLVFIPVLYLAGIIGALIFVLLNPVNKKDGSKGISLSHYLSKIDYKLIYFFICLFIFVGLMQANGTIGFIELLIENISGENEFVLALIILITTSILSGFLDNTPVTVIFIPVIRILVGLPEFYSFPIIIAFILGVNLGGNFLPQGSAADLMTLEIARNYDVKDMSYKRLFKVGGLFALIHILLGVGYLAFLIFLL
jgi:Na+/H+ antiporter NhaD/arsenite permease-like protein